MLYSRSLQQGSIVGILARFRGILARFRSVIPGGTVTCPPPLPTLSYRVRQQTLKVGVCGTKSVSGVFFCFVFQ